MPTTAAERQKKYIEKLKRENPEKYEEKRLKHLQKVKERQKQQPKIKVAKVKKPKLNEKQKLESDVALLKQQNKVLENKVLLLNKRIKTLQKTFNRFKEKLHNLQIIFEANEEFKLINNVQGQLNSESRMQHQNEATPFTKATSFVEETLPTTSDENKDKIKKKLFELNILSDSLKTSYLKADTNKTKETLKKIVDNEITNKYKMKNKLSLKLGIKRIRKKPQVSKLRIQTIHTKDIESFFCRDDVSRATAGKQETKTKHKNKKQKRYLLDSLLNLHKKYRQEGGKLSYATFVRLKPFYVLRPTINDRNTCGCTKHSNLSFKATKLKSLRLIESDNLPELIEKVACDYKSKDCMYSTCTLCKNISFEIKLNDENENKQTSWWKWILKKHSYTKQTKEGPKEMTTKKIVKELVTGSVKQLVTEFKEELLLFKKHFFNISHQYKQFKNCTENLQNDEVAILCDFSENYTCKLAEQVQSAHFGSSQNQFSLHTGVLYTRDSQPISFCTISPSTAHDPGAIWAHLNPIIDYAKSVCPLLRVIHIFSDGPTTQYRQKKNFFLLSKIIGESVIEYATWNFFEASHGKGPADGVGGAIKRKLDQMVAYGKDIPDSKAAFDLLKSSESKIKIFYITEEIVHTLQDLIPTNLVAVVGTLNIHQIITTNEYSTICCRDLSCFCNLGTSKALCECYNEIEKSKSRERYMIEKKNDTLQKRKREVTGNKITRKRKKVPQSESSESDEDSDITYAETDLDEIASKIESESSMQDQDIETEIAQKDVTHEKRQIVTEERQFKEVIKDNQKENKVPKFGKIGNNCRDTITASEKVLSQSHANMILDETTGSFKLKQTFLDEKIDLPDQTKLKEIHTNLPKTANTYEQKVKEQTQKIETIEISEKEEEEEKYDDMVKENGSELKHYPSSSSTDKIFHDNIDIASDELQAVTSLKRGEFVLVKFQNQRNKVFYFVCRIEDLSHNKLVVQGFKSKKKKNIFGIIKNDISIIDEEDIVEILDQPKEEGKNFIFPMDINVREI